MRILTTSADLAALMNTHAPATPEDAAETPLDWTGGLWFGGDTYEVDAVATTADTLVLTNGAAVRFSPAGQYCGGEDAGCGHVRNGAVASMAAHWIPADFEKWDDDTDCTECNEATCGVIRDYRSVTVWDGDGFSQRDVYDTVEDAKKAYAEEVQEVTEMSAETGRHVHTDED
ncbi:hypothetical protein [Streptomyces halobius]|uniref:Uncharacterized protein n=1 Tax=Streptomyces halobius TaxID=2879846 RepID=A0ABY4M118_9ACTN|nr:hypothetical protein [Streptomyces halobius]UQA91373.1 hypothetical protein K9S39_05305 [Streptomyces halobius]